MISLNEKTYKTLAQNLTKEVNTVTNNKTINQAKALEIHNTPKCQDNFF